MRTHQVGRGLAPLAQFPEQIVAIEGGCRNHVHLLTGRIPVRQGDRAGVPAMSCLTVSAQVGKPREVDVPLRGLAVAVRELEFQGQQLAEEGGADPFVRRGDSVWIQARASRRSSRPRTARRRR